MARRPIREYLPGVYQTVPAWVALADALDEILVQDLEDSVARYYRLRDPRTMDQDFLWAFHRGLGVPMDPKFLPPEKLRIMLEQIQGFFAKSGTVRFADFLSYVTNSAFELIPLYANRDSIVETVTAAQLQTGHAIAAGSVGAGAGWTGNNYAGTVPGPVIPKNFRATFAGVQGAVVDDGNGRLHGTVYPYAGTVTGTIDYVTGDVTLACAASLAGQSVSFQYNSGYRVGFPPISKAALDPDPLSPFAYNVLIQDSSGTPQVITDRPVPDPDTDALFQDNFGVLEGDISALPYLGRRTIAYKDGIIGAVFTSAPVAPVTVTYGTDDYRTFRDPQRFVIGTGDGVTQAFVFALGAPGIGAETVRVTDGTEIFLDTISDVPGLPAGVLVGNKGGSGVVDYDLATGSVTFATPPAVGSQIVLTALDRKLLEQGGTWYLTDHVILRVDYDKLGLDEADVADLFYQVAPVVLRLQAIELTVTHGHAPGALDVEGPIIAPGLVELDEVEEL